ncbi:uncharacterized protein LOC120353436 [Nilaparvata lugens]|uniref:uncharacterized protein LOC120353436 n=1 Tax=Nilaparvata lugens TaxID=108931 RepID=UPI00193DB304|nr:uncharacterized protein LOC120353436 [Nilaparvata lugens]
MHCMIDLTVYFLFFIALSKCAVLKNKAATEEDNMAKSPEKLDTSAAAAAAAASVRDKRIFLLFKNQNGKIFTTDIEEDAILNNGTNSEGTNQEDQEQDADPWSVIWYLGAFSGLITFFLVVTCSEWCCGNHLYTRHYGANQVYASSFTHQAYRPPDTPPPPYHLFAPPSYKESVAPEKGAAKGGVGVKSLRRLGVFVIPVHRVKTTTPSDAAAAT